MNRTEGFRLALTTSLITAAYITWTCPCSPLLSCHATEFLLLTGGPFVTVWANLALLDGALG